MPRKLCQGIALGLLITLVTVGQVFSADGFTYRVGIGPAVYSGTGGQKSNAGGVASFSVSLMPDPINSSDVQLVANFSHLRFLTDNAREVIVSTAGLDIKLDRVISRSPNMFIAGGAGVARTVSLTREVSPYLNFGIGLETRRFTADIRWIRVTAERFKDFSIFPLTLSYRL